MNNFAIYSFIRLSKLNFDIRLSHQTTIFKLNKAITTGDSSLNPYLVVNKNCLKNELSIKLRSRSIVKIKSEVLTRKINRIM